MRSCRQIRIEGNIAYVPLTKGYEAVIDAADVPLIEGRDWFASVRRRSNGSVRAVYAAQKQIGAGKWPPVLMHRIIANTPDGMETDHRDGDGLNNRRDNLRPATKAQNAFNQKMSVRNASGFKGVYWDKVRAKWQAQISVGGSSRSLGHFTAKEEAATAYAKASAELHGEFGRAI